ncbi:RluA family pseudouridine synthase [Patescibacteria group bacterium]|nr:RluA family pseudouridine synthase [Patescibacteria group bacterium]MBU1705430.1 RluA family pseudouridine synthase [Patescibacteria group bacterium]
MEILYEDNHCLAVVKPHGMLTQGDASGEESLMEQVKEFIKKRDRKPGRVFLGLVHRLDRPVGGIVLLAKTSKGASRLSEQFRAHKIQKTYLAVTEGVPEPRQGEVRQWLKKDVRTNTVAVVKAQTPGAKEAVLTYQVLKTKGTRAWVEIKPQTGRPHQIRVAMSSLGAPIAGDAKYGAQPAKNGQIALFATGLVFAQPVTQEKIELKTAPQGAVWKR